MLCGFHTARLAQLALFRLIQSERDWSVSRKAVLDLSKTYDSLAKDLMTRKSEAPEFNLLSASVALI